MLVGATTRGNLFSGQVLEHRLAYQGGPKTTNCSQGAEIPFKELQVPWRRPQLLEVGTCPYTGMVVYQVLQLGMYLQNNGSKVGRGIIKGPPRSSAPRALEDRCRWIKGLLYPSPPQ